MRYLSIIVTGTGAGCAPTMTTRGHRFLNTSALVHRCLAKHLRLGHESYVQDSEVIVQIAEGVCCGGHLFWFVNPGVANEERLGSVVILAWLANGFL